MPARYPLLTFAGTLLIQCLVGCAGSPTPLPTDEGIPVNQWYMNTTDTDGAKLSHYVAEYGVEAKPGSTAIVLHGGWGAEHSYLVPAIKPLANEYRFVLYDQRGSLRSPANPPAKITYAHLIEDLDQLRQRLGLEKVTLVAHSMGNMLAYGYLRAHPDRVAGLVLMGPVLPGYDSGTEESPRLAELCVTDVWPEFSMADALARAARIKELERGYKDRWARIAVAEGLIPADWAVHHPPETDPDLDALYIKTDQQKTMSWRILYTCTNTYSGRNWREMLGGMVFYDPDVSKSIFAEPDYRSMVDAAWPALKSFKGPVRVIIGTHDYCDPGPTFWPKLVTAIPDARLDTIQNAGHSPWMDEPEKFTQSLRSALEATTLRPSPAAASPADRSPAAGR
jgi:proline iminopeptidase